MNRHLKSHRECNLGDADVILFMIDAISWRGEDEMVLDKLKQIQKR